MRLWVASPSSCPQFSYLNLSREVNRLFANDRQVKHQEVSRHFRTINRSSFAPLLSTCLVHFLPPIFCLPISLNFLNWDVGTDRAKLFVPLRCQKMGLLHRKGTKNAEERAANENKKQPGYVVDSRVTFALKTAILFVLRAQ